MVLALPIEMLPKQSAGLASGIILSAGYVGALFGPWLAGRILDSTGSFNPALIVLAASAAAWVVVGLLIPETGKKPVQ